jgi:hypothetical protein
MNKIRQIIKEYIEEAFTGEHSLERLKYRFVDKKNLIVGYELEDSIGDYKTLGTYSLNDDEKEEIVRKYKFIENYNFSPQESYGVRLTSLNIDPKRIKFFSDEDKKESINKKLLFVDEITNSNGNEIYAIIRDNVIATIYFAKNYIPQNTRKLRVDNIIKNELFFSGLDNKKDKKHKEGSRKKIELNLPKVIIGNKEWYIDEVNEKLIYSKNIKKEVPFDMLTEKQFEELIELI